MNISQTLYDTSQLDLEIAHRVDAFFRNKYRTCHLSGAYLIAKDQRLHMGSIGEKSTLESPHIEINDVFQLASVSKFITSLIVLRMYEQGKLKLTDMVTKYFPEFPYKNVSIHQLLSHRSGLPEYTYLSDSGWAGDSVWKSNLDAVELLSQSKQPAYFSPGKKFDYSNSNYMMLAAICERIEMKPFYQIVQSQIAIPFELKSLHAYNPKSKVSNQYPIVGMRGNHKAIEPHLLDGVLGDKSIYSNVWDLYKLGFLFMNKHIIADSTQKKMLMPYSQTKIQQHYGYGLRRTKLDDGSTWYFHNGWWHGFRSYFWMNLKSKEMVIVLTNRLKCGFLNPRDIIWLMHK